MGTAKLSTTIVVLLVYFLKEGPHNVKASPQSCSVDADCVPQVECNVITWECNATDPYATTPVPGQSKACCEYLDTCGDGEQVSGWVWSRKTTREYKGKNHKSHWIDMYVAQGNDTYIVSQYAGSWNTFTENCTSCDTDDEVPSEIYVLEPVSTCADGTRIWPEWYQVALATVDDELNITALTLDTPENRSCLCDLTYTCSDQSICEYTTEFDIGESPNSTLPEIVDRRKCSYNLGIERSFGTLNASSIFASGYDVDTARYNVWVEADSVEGGWAPNLNDVEKWLKVIFDLETWVSGIITQGLALNIERRVDSFVVEYENISGDTYTVGHQNKVFYAGPRFDTEVTNYFPGPVRAVAIIIHILTPCDPGYIGMRFELLGCDVCFNNSMCEAGGLCLDSGICSYDGLILNEDNYNAGLNLLQDLNGTDEEKFAYDTLVGYLGPLENISTIVFNNITLNVAKATILALTNLTAEGNRTASENGALAIDKVEFLVLALGHEETAAFGDLDTPEAIEEATVVVQSIVDLVALLFLPENSGGWEVNADISQGTYDPVLGQYIDDGTNDTDGDVIVDADGRKYATENSLSKQEQRELAKADAASNIASGMGKITATVVTQQPQGAELHIQGGTIEVHAIHAEPAKLEDQGYTFKTEPGLAAVVDVPADSFNFDGYNGTAQTTVATVVIDTSALRSALEARQGDPEAGIQQDIGRIASNFISFDLIVGGVRVSIPITYSLSHDPAANDITGRLIEAPRCVFHDEAVKDYIAFSTQGVWIQSTGKNETTCETDHSTTFAVMMYLSDINEIDNRHLGIQDTLTKVCSGLSIFALAVAIGILIYLRSTLMSERIIIHMTLMITTLLATLTFMVGASRTENEVLCKVITIILHFLYTAMFSWMLVEGVHLYRQIITVFESEKSRLWVYFVLGWGIPVVIVAVAGGVEWEKYGTAGFCFLQFKDHTLWAFIGPIIPVILINFIVLIRVAKVVVMAAKLQDTGDGATDTVNRVKAGLRSSMLLLPILGMTWVIGFIQHLAIALAYIFVIVNSLQGFFMALFHCFLSTEPDAPIAPSTPSMILHARGAWSNSTTYQESQG